VVGGPRHERQRNYYRVLQAQPDAPLESLRANYRTLLQKLRVHPDLGGSHRDATLINEAFQTLRNPTRRAAYDSELFARYEMGALSLGPYWAGAVHPSSRRAVGSGANSRHYYRVLQVQADAPGPVIAASYRALRAEGWTSGRLLDEAFSVIGNPNARAHYDRLLAEHGHEAAVRLLRGAPGESTSPSGLALPLAEARSPEPNAPPGTPRRCPFCRTPLRPTASERSRCPECQSPVPRSRLTGAPAARQVRDATRRNRPESVRLFDRWPTRSVPAVVLDISPTGVRVSSPRPLTGGTVVKLDADSFTAIARAARCCPEVGWRDGWQIGLEFIAASFGPRGGGFLDLRA